MWYLIGEIVLFLFIAAVFGFLLGWWLKGYYKNREIENLQNISQANLFSRDEELKAAKTALKECQSQLRETPARASAAASPPVARSAESRDDLKKVYGIGPVLEKVLNREGITTFRQLALLSDRDIQVLSEKIGPFKNRIQNDNWREGAKEQHFRQHGERL